MTNLNKYTILLILILVFPTTSGAYVIDRIEAVVNGKVITKSEVEIAARAEAVRQGKPEPGQELTRQALDSIINRTLLLQEADKFNIVEVTPEEVDAALASVKKGFGSDDAFARALSEEEITQDELRVKLRDQLLVGKYVDRRIKFFVRVSLDEIKVYYDANSDRFGGKSLSEAHDDIRQLLIEKATATKLDEYLAELRKKSKITLF